MMMSWRGAVLLTACVLMMTGCVPVLKSDLPTGPAAYQTVAVSKADTVNSLILLQPKDELKVNVFNEEDLTTPDAVVDQAGNLSMPLIGEIHAGGLSPEQLAKAVERAYAGKYLRDPHVNIVLIKPAPRVISVEGEVKNPGVYEVQQGYTLLSALAMAGSPLETAKFNEVLIFRQKDGQRMGGRFNVTDIRAGRADDPAVLPGDVIVVGYARARGAFLDFLKLAPVFSVFTRY
jgi:polysaccharide export outer membrane protein